MELKKFEDLKGHTLKRIENRDDNVFMELEDGTTCSLYHDQDCCESVVVEDVIGDLNDLIGSPLTMAEEETSEKDPPDNVREYHDESHVWTFYKLATIKGYVTIRWLGESNGYYSTSVDFKVH